MKNYNRRKFLSTAISSAAISFSPEFIQAQNFEKDEESLNQKVNEKVNQVLEDLVPDKIVTNDSHPDPDVDDTGMVKGIDY